MHTSKSESSPQLNLTCMLLTVCRALSRAALSAVTSSEVASTDESVVESQKAAAGRSSNLHRAGEAGPWPYSVTRSTELEHVHLFKLASLVLITDIHQQLKPSLWRTVDASNEVATDASNEVASDASNG